MEIPCELFFYSREPLVFRKFALSICVNDEAYAVLSQSPREFMEHGVLFLITLCDLLTDFLNFLTF